MLLDTPPVSAVADASAIATVADGVLVVIDLTRTHRNDLLVAAEQLHNARARTSASFSTALRRRRLPSLRGPASTEPSTHLLRSKSGKVSTWSHCNRRAIVRRDSGPGRDGDAREPVGHLDPVDVEHAGSSEPPVAVDAKFQVRGGLEQSGEVPCLLSVVECLTYVVALQRACDAKSEGARSAGPD